MNKQSSSVLMETGAKRHTERLLFVFEDPLNLLLVILFSVFAGEFIVTLFFDYVLHPVPLWEGLFDAALLTLIIFPAISLLILRPLRRQIAERERAEAEKEASVTELQRAFAEIKMLRGIIPICASCKNIRDDQGRWQALEEYIRDHSEADFSHSLCPECAVKFVSSLQVLQRKA